MATTIAKNDIVISTALVMGRKAPVIVTAPWSTTMRAGSVIVDLAADAGGNCEATVAGRATPHPNGVTILGCHNWPGRIAVASVRSLFPQPVHLPVHLLGQGSKGATLADDDDIVHGVMLTRGGAIVHPEFALKQAA